MQYLLTEDEHQEYQDLKYKGTEPVIRDSSLLDETKEFFSKAYVKVLMLPSMPAQESLRLEINTRDIPENYYNLIKGITNEFRG